MASPIKVWTDNENIQPKLPPSGITHLQVDIADHPAADLFSVLPTCLTFLTDALGNAFLMTADDYSLDHTMKYICEGQPNVSPNLGFQHHLRFFEESRCDITKASALYK